MVHETKVIFTDDRFRARALPLAYCWGDPLDQTGDAQSKGKGRFFLPRDRMHDLYYSFKIK